MEIPPLIAGLLKPEAYPHPAAAPQLLETHISWVILAGAFAYKIKKPLALDFLDFSTLAARRHFCAEEIRLNRRLAPEIYLGVVAITGSPERPRVGAEIGMGVGMEIGTAMAVEIGTENDTELVPGSDDGQVVVAGPDGKGADGAAGAGSTGPDGVLEYAVRMRAFPVDATLDREEAITAGQIDAIATTIAAFHQSLPPVAAESTYGRPEAVVAPVAANFLVLSRLLAATDATALLDRLRQWCRAEEGRLQDHFAGRKENGWIRECHGDLHLGNIAWVDGRPLVFDALEFNPALRSIDVVSELAFLAMDLHHRGRGDLAWRLVDRYLAQTGDSAGLAAFAYYQVYRAMVRAKVRAILAAEHPEGGAETAAEALGYLQLADKLAHGRRPGLVLMHGLSGSGKSWLSGRLLERLGAIRLRSDIVRKRLFGLAPDEGSDGIAGGIYTPEADGRTLAALLAEARLLLAEGFTVLVDATFLRPAWRRPFAEMAAEMALPWRIVAVRAAPEVLRARVAARQGRGEDASEAGPAVLEAQLAYLEGLAGGAAGAGAAGLGAVGVETARAGATPVRAAGVSGAGAEEATADADGFSPEERRHTLTFRSGNPLTEVSAPVGTAGAAAAAAEEAAVAALADDIARLEMGKLGRTEPTY